VRSVQLNVLGVAPPCAVRLGDSEVRLKHGQDSEHAKQSRSLHSLSFARGPSRLRTTVNLLGLLGNDLDHAEHFRLRAKLSPGPPGNTFSPGGTP
jgi:hypothetical protein